MKKITSIILAILLTFSCMVPAFAAESLEDKDKVVEITIDNPFGDPIVVDFGYNKYFDVSEFLPAIEVNGYTYIDFCFWVQDEMYDFFAYVAHILMGIEYGMEVKTDETTGITVTYDTQRFGDRTDEIQLRTSVIEDIYANRKVPAFALTRAFDSNFVPYCYTVELLNADGTLADSDEYMEYHQMRIIFDLPDDAPLGLYEIHHDFADASGRGAIDYAFNYNGTLTYILDDWIEWGEEEA